MHWPFVFHQNKKPPGKAQSLFGGFTFRVFERRSYITPAHYAKFLPEEVIYNNFCVILMRGLVATFLPRAYSPLIFGHIRLTVWIRICRIGKQINSR
jgi:hypothetical protein